MANITQSPNMLLPVPNVGLDSGPDWANNLNSCLGVIDGHNHSVGSGVQIQPAGLNINSALTFQNNPATNLQASVYTVQSSLSTLQAVYVKGVDLYYNDGSSNVIQLTSGGSVNATSSGISSGTASASFVSSVLVVNQNTNTPGNIKAGSISIGNNVAASKFTTISAHATLAANYTWTLPSGEPVANGSLIISDTSGNLSYGGVDNSTLTESVGILSVANQGITATQIANGTITGTQIVTNVDLNGKSVQVGGNNVIASSTNNTNGLLIIRGHVSSSGSILSGEGFTVSHLGTGDYGITYQNAFSDVPSVVATSISFILIACCLAPTVSGCAISLNTAGSVLTDSDFTFIAIGQRS